MLNRLQNFCSVFGETSHLSGFRRIKGHQISAPPKCRAAKFEGKSWIHSASHTLDPLRLVFCSASSLLPHTCLFCLELKWAQVQSLQTNKFPAFQGRRLFFPSALKESCFSSSEASLSVICRAALCLPKVQPSKLQKHVEKNTFSYTVTDIWSHWRHLAHLQDIQYLKFPLNVALFFK